VMKGDSALISANGNANQWGKIILCDVGAGTTYQNYSLGHAFKIGTTSPITYLTINSNLITTGPSTRIQMGAQDASDIYQATGANLYGSFLPFGNTGNTVFKNSYTAGAYQFFTAPSVDGTLVEALRIVASGNVGIGKTSPTSKLDVSGSGNFTNNLTVTGSFTVVTGSTVEFQVNQTGVKIGNATTDSHAVTGSVSISSSFSTSGSALTVYKSGSSVLDIQGSQGQLFSVIDALSGSLMSVNDVSGLPILEVFSDDRVVMGTYGAPALVISGSNTVSSGSLRGRVVTVPTASGTASMDCSQSNFFSLTLSGSSTLFLSASNIQPGQTVNLRVIQPATSGSLNYGSQFKFAGGIPYSASSTGSAVDLISFISYDTAVLYGSAIKNLS
jgi:hypothetical protein